MNENEALVLEQDMEQPVEQVEQKTESPKLYTEEEFNTALDEALRKKVARKEAKLTKEYEKKYGGLLDVLRAGTGKDTVDELTDTFGDFYAKKGISVKEKANYSDHDTKILAKAEADEIIQAGMDEVVDEIDRLTKLGADKMTAREKAVFVMLTNYHSNSERVKALEQLGIPKEVYNSKEFTDFAGQFTKNVPIAEIYKIYDQTKPKKEIKTMGSMKNTTGDDSGVKDFYTRDEALKYSRKDLDKNPALFKAIVNSMHKW